MKTRRFVVAAVVWALLVAAAALPAAAQNLVVNGDFEGGWTGSFNFQNGTPAGTWLGTGWSAWTNPFPPTQFSQPGDPSYWEMPGNDGVADPINNFQRIIGGSIKNSSMRGGLVQQIATTPGAQYDLDFIAAFTPSAVKDGAGGQYGIDLTGQVQDGNAASIVWSDMTAADWWNTYSRRFTASGSQVSIWFRGQVSEATATIIVDVDDVSVTSATGSVITIEERPYDPESLFPPPDPVKVTQVDETTFRFEWETDVPSTSTVEYDTTAPGKGAAEEGVIDYAGSVSDDTLTTQHSVVVSGLEIDTLYHFRVISDAPGYKSAVSLNDTFLTPPPAQASFVNGGFEDGEGSQPDGWTQFGVTDGRLGPHPPDGPTSSFGVKAHEGEYFIASIASHEVKNGGFWQRIQAEAGKTYTAIMNYKNFQVGSSAEDQPVLSSIGIDPFGGVDWTSDTVIWTDAADLAAQPGAPYMEASVDAQAQADAVTIFVRFTHKFPIQFNITAIDNVRIELPEVTVGSIGEARAQQENANVSFEPGTQMVVTLVPVSETGYFYMEDADGTGGIRVQSDAAVSIGDTVSVTGKLERLANGELALVNSNVTITGSGASVPVWSMNNKAVGGESYAGGQGLSNEGLLVKVWGEVQSFDFLTEEMIIDDGSNVNAGDGQTGLRVVKTGQFPSVGQYVSVVGVVGSEMVGGQKVRVIRGRENMVPGDWEVIQF